MEIGLHLASHHAKSLAAQLVLTGPRQVSRLVSVLKKEAWNSGVTVCMLHLLIDDKHYLHENSVCVVAEDLLSGRMPKLFQFTFIALGAFALGFFLRGAFWLPVETRIVHQDVAVVEPTVTTPDVPVAVVEVAESLEPVLLEANLPQVPYLSPEEQISNLEQIINRRQYGQALQGLVSEWIEHDPVLSDAEKASLQEAVALSAQHSGSMPAEVLLSSVIGQLSSEDLRSAWKTAHLESPMRAAIFSELITSELEQHSPAELLETTAGWTSWERGRYSDALLTSLAQTDLETAVQWGIESPDAFGADAIRDLFILYSKSDLNGLEQSLSQITDPRVREGAIEALVARRVMNTEAAMAWADSLATAEEQAIAHDAIYEMTPRGIGVSVLSEDGFPKVMDVVRSDNGLQKGDRIVSISENGAEPVDAFGRELVDVVDVLRGEPGSVVTIQVLRTNPESGEVEQVEATITREQLYFE
jgi:hypothetical protein